MERLRGLMLLASTGDRLLDCRERSEIRAVVWHAARTLCDDASGTCVVLGRVDGPELLVEDGHCLPEALTGSRLPVAAQGEAPHSALSDPAGALLSSMWHWLTVSVGMDRALLIGARQPVADDIADAFRALGTQARLAEGNCASHAELGRQARRDQASAELMSAATRTEAINGVLTWAVRLDDAVHGAAIMIGNSTLRIHGTTGDAGSLRGGQPLVLGDLPSDVTDAIAATGSVAWTGVTAVRAAEAAGLTPEVMTMAASLSVRDEQFGLLVLTVDAPPTVELSRAVVTLATQAALALDQLLVTERFRVIIEGSPDAHILASAQGSIRFTNPAAERLLGIPAASLARRHISTVIHPDDLQAILNPGFDPFGAVPHLCRVLTDGDTWAEVEAVVVRVTERDGSTSLVINARDISDRQRLEAELRHAQKLESVGRLAGGIAHEINTPVQFVGDNVRFLQQAFTDIVQLNRSYADVIEASLRSHPETVEKIRKLENDIDLDFVLEEVPQALTQTLEGVDRVATIVRAMRAFGHPAGAEKAPVNLNEAISTTLVVANNELKYVADVNTDFGALPPVICHVGDINQVVLNLVVNAAHAVIAANRGRGLVEVSTRLDGDQVVIAVTDSGIGIPAEIADKIFEPFFTTKEVGTGTGQGLALAHSLVVERHGGRVEFTSRPGIGTTFRVRLPVNGSVAPRATRVVE